MSNNFQASEFCPVAFQSYGQQNVATLNVTGHSMDLSTMLYDVSHTGLSGRTGRLAGKGDASGNVNADFDADLPPYLNPPNIRDGISGFMFFYYSALALGRPFQRPMIWEKVHYEQKIGSQIKWNGDVKENVIIGFPVYPAQ